MCVIEPTIRHLPTTMPTKIHHTELHEIAENVLITASRNYHFSRPLANEYDKQDNGADPETV